MRYGLFIRRLCLCFIGVLFASPALAAKPILNIQHWQTSNGAAVYFVRRPEIPMVDVQLAFAAGSAYDGQTPGLAYTVNAMLDQGTSTHNANDIAVSLDALGAVFATSVNRDMALVSLRSVSDPKYLNPALKVFESVLSESNFPENAFQRTKQQIKAGIQASEQQPISVASNAFYNTLYGHDPYAHPVSGTTESIDHLMLAEVKDFYQRYYVAKNADLIIVGDLTLDSAKRLAEDVTENLPAGEKAHDLVFSAKPSAQQKLISFPAKQDTIILGEVAVPRNSPDYFPLVVGNQILGGGTMTSILFNQVRNDKGLAYGISSQFQFLRYSGPFAIVLQTRTDKAQQALGVTRDALSRFIKKGPTQSQLKAAQRNIVGNFPLQIEKNSQIEAVLTRMAFYHLPMNYLDTYRQNIKAVTVKQVQQAFAKYLDPENRVTIIVGPTAYE